MAQSCCTTFSKYWIGVFSLILFLAAIAIIVISLTLFNFNEIVPNEDYTDINKIITWVIIGLAIVLAEISVLGILLIWKKSKCISLIYSIQLIILFIIFAAIAIGIYIAFQKVNDKITCENLSILEDADKLFQDGSKLLCSQDCSCKATKEWLQTYLYENGRNYQTDAGAVKVNVIVQLNQNCQKDCKNYEQYIGGSQDNLIKSIKWIEENLDCSGICTASAFYLYSDINSKTKPQKACLQSIKDKISDISNIVSYATGGVAIILFITLICNFVICCCSKERKKPQETQKKYQEEELQQIN